MRNGAEKRRFAGEERSGEEGDCRWGEGVDVRCRPFAACAIFGDSAPRMWDNMKRTIRILACEV